jgi:hypothetical protein
MARTVLVAQPVTDAGLAATYVAADAANGMTYRLIPHRLLHIKNGGGASITVTITTPLTVNGLAVADRTATVGAGTDQFFSLGVDNAYQQPDGTVFIDFSSATTVTVAVLDA